MKKNILKKKKFTTKNVKKTNINQIKKRSSNHLNTSMQNLYITETESLDMFLEANNYIIIIITYNTKIITVFL